MNFENRAEAALFDERLDDYIRSRHQTPIRHFSLATAFEICQIRWSSQIFSGLVDLQVNAILVITDLTEAHHLWRRLDEEGHLPNAQWANGELFSARMQIHHILSGVAFRYRALWDKFFDLLLTMRFKRKRPLEEAENIIRSAGITEGKKALRRVLRETPMSPENIVMIHRYLTRFDQLYRTPEAHTAGGSMLKWTLPHFKMDGTPLEEFLLDAWNLWNSAERTLGQVFSERALNLLRKDRAKHDTSNP
jgi:hypothetical protein